jgi:hypothetical protein
MFNSGSRGKRAKDGTGTLSVGDHFNQQQYLVPVVTSFSITDGTYAPLDDTAANTAGGQICVVNGSGFAPGATIIVGTTTIGSVTYLDSNRLTFTTPALSSGSYTIIVSNASGGAGILLPGLVYSGVPTYTTSAGSLGSVYEASAFTQSVVATGDTPITYSLYSGSLPSGATLNSNGTITGTSPLDSSSTTYSFTIRATDPQLQDSDRSFTLTINTDPVSWTTPAANGTVYTSYEYTPISNVILSAASAGGKSITYSANVLPGGITLSGNTISGTNNLVGNTYTRLTATAANTSRTNTRDVVFNVTPDIVTWSSPANTTSYTIIGGSAMANITLAATSAAGQNVSYTANALPAGTTISGNTIYGTPSTAQTVNTLLTATSAVTNRSATRYISWSISLNDLYFKYTTLALNASTTANTFINDASNNNFALTIAGDTKPNLFNPYRGDGYYSYYFDGGSWVLGTLSTGVTIGNSDFCYEAWGYWNNFNYGTYGAPLTTLSGATGGEIMIRATKTAGASTSANFYIIVGSTYIPSPMYSAGISCGTLYLNRWHHLAMQRVAGNWFFYVDGVLVYATSAGDAAITLPLTKCHIGNDTGSGYGYMSGFVSNVRLTVGNVPYATAGFTVPTTPLTNILGTKFLSAQSNRFLDTSVSYATMTLSSTATAPLVSPVVPFTLPTSVTVSSNNSVLFNGTTDYLTIADNAILELGTSNFTIEVWIYLIGTGTATILAHRASAITNGPLALYKPIGTTLNLYLATGTSGWDIFNGAAIGTLTQNAWTHVSVSRSGSNFYASINGVVSSVGTSASSIGDTADTWSIGADVSNNNYFNGYISNLRIVKGTAVYTTTFTPSTTPLTALANTTLLTCQTDSTIKDNSTNAFVITPTGSPKVVNNAYPFTQTATTVSNLDTLGSTYFDGSGDYLTLPSNQGGLSMATGDFTIEMWVYISSLSTARTLYDTMNASDATGTGRFAIQVSTGGVVQIFTGAGSVFTSGGTLVAGTWYHIAYSRASASGRLYVNGVQVNTTYSDSYNYVIGNTSRPIIGVNAYDNSSNPMLGYIEDLRVVKGTALYTSNFAPPFAPLTPVANTQLLTCQTNGGASNYNIIDSSPLSNTITRVGNTTQTTFSPYSQTGWSTYLNAGNVDNYLNVVDNPNLRIGTSPFTIEGWVYLNSLSTTAFFINKRSYNGTGTGTWTIYITTAGAVTFAELQTPTDLITTASSTIVINTWYHIAVTRDASNILRIFVNGVSVGTTAPTNSFNYSASNDILIGRDNSAAALKLNGYVSNIRLLIGTALYTSAFTPSTTPLTPIANTRLLTCQSNNFVDNSANNCTLTISGSPQVQALSPFGSISESAPLSYSTFFNGSTDYLTIPTNSAFAFGTGDFTVECWVYQSTLAAAVLIDLRGAVSVVAPSFELNGTGKLLIYKEGTGTLITSSSSISAGTWNHVAFTRNGTTVRLFVNGALDATTVTDSTSWATPTTKINIGSSYVPGSYLNGYISNLRVVKGTAVYTAGFTPSTTPLALSQGSSANTAALGIPTNGNSIYFNGSTDYLIAPTNAAFAFGTGDFTVECWIYVTSTTNGNQSILSSNGGWGAGAVVVKAYHTGFISLSAYDYNAGGAKMLSYATPMNQWVHVAITRSGTTFTLYVNGTNQSTVTSSITINFNSSGTLIGYNGTIDTTSSYMTGYISNLRVVKGTAVYTGNFTPSTVPLLPSQSSSANTAAISYVPTNGGSYYFPGATTDYLTAPASTAWNFTGDWTFECWVYPTDLTAYRTMLAQWGGSVSTFIWKINSSGRMYLENLSTALTATSTTIVINQWQHIALTRSSNTIRMFVNGVLDATTATRSGTYYSTDAMYIGKSQVNEPFLGYISNLRVINGSALYTATFTPPTSPLTAVANTALLTAQANTIIDVSNNQFPITLNGYVRTTGGISPFAPNTTLLLIGQSNTIIDSSNNNISMNAIGSVYVSKSFSPFGNTAALLACQSTRIIDSSNNSFNITTSGSPKLFKLNPFGYTAQSYTNYTANTHGGSIYFNGNGSYLTVPSNFNFTLGTNNHTIECWFYAAGTQQTYTTLWSYANGAANQSTNSYYLNIGQSAGALLLGNGAAGWGVNLSITPPAQNAWHHVAVVRNGNVFTVYMDGVSVGTATYAATISAQGANSFEIGGQVTGSGNLGNTIFLGYISDFRFTNGVAIYTSNFIPPTRTITNYSTSNTSALLLTGTNGGIVDAHPTNNGISDTVGSIVLAPEQPFAGSYYSNYFDGTGDYLTVPSNAALEMGTGDFTMECWAYPVSFGNGFMLYIHFAGASTARFGFTLTASGVTVDSLMGLGLTFSGTTAITVGQWYHVAVTRSGSSFKTWINGVQCSTATSSGTYSPTGVIATIGDYPDDYATGYGYISNLRIIKGTALYTSTFNPPTAPLTAISGTSLLTCQSNRFIDNSTNAISITKVGNAAVKTFNPFQNNPGKSIYFNGSSYIGGPTSTSLDTNYLRGDFTIEGWVYPTTLAASVSLITYGTETTSRFGPFINTSGQLAYDIYGVGTSTFAGANTIPVNAWSHFAFVRSSGSISAYVNGARQGAIVSNSSDLGNGQVSIGVGSTRNASYYTGYMRDLRISKNARYTANNQVDLTQSFIAR